MAIATQDPPKEKRDKQILEEDYKSYDSNQAADDKKDDAFVAPQNVNENAQQNVIDNQVADVVEANKNDVAANAAVVNVNQMKENEYVENFDSNNAEETYHDIEEGGVARGDEGFKKAVVPDFKGPTNERQTAVVNAFQHAWTGYKKYAWGHDHLRFVFIQVSLFLFKGQFLKACF